VALIVWNGDLYLGGQFSTAGGVPASHIARWDGANWHPMGSGMNHGVYAFTTHNGQLVVGGEFGTVNDINIEAVASWNGSSWSGYGISNGASICYALNVYNDELIVGGFINGQSVMRYNGTALSSMGLGVQYSNVRSLLRYKNELITGGDFIKA